MTTTVEKLMNLESHILAKINEAEKSEDTNVSELIRVRSRIKPRRIDRALLDEWIFIFYLVH